MTFCEMYRNSENGCKGCPNRYVCKNSTLIEEKTLQKTMWKNEFAIQLMAKGSFLDSDSVNGHLYLVEAFTIRLNHIALNAWIMSEMMNSRDCYSTAKEWEAHKAEYKAKRKSVHEQILSALGIEPNAVGISIKQIQSEVFAVVHISEIKVK